MGTSASNEPLYNIGAVIRLTGISAATLHAWERRYEFPKAARTAGGHRLFSEKDILRLRWVKARTEEGMTISRAIHALELLEASGEWPAEDTAGPALAGRLPDSHAPGSATDALAYALLAQRLDEADQIIAERLATVSPEAILLDLIAPTLVEIGNKWERGEINIAAEHFATNYLRQRTAMWLLSSPPPLARPSILLACAPEDWHEGSLLILSTLLRRRRWPITYLGQATPLPDLANLVRNLRPAMVVVTATTEDSANLLLDWPRWLPEAESGKPIFGFGGRIFTQSPVWRERMPGRYLGNTLEEGVQTIEALLL